MIKQIRQIAGIIASFEMWVVGCVVAASFVYPRALLLAVGVAAFFWILRWIADGRLTRRTPVDAAVFLLLVMVPVTLWATVVPDKTIPQVYRLLTGVALFYAIVNWCNHPRRLRLLLLGISFAGFILALFAAISVKWPVNKLPLIFLQLYQKFTILVSDTVNPNVMAGSLILLLPIFLARLLFLWKEMHWPERILLSESVLAMLLIATVTQSRGSWIALIAIFLILAILRWRWGWLSLIPSTVFALVAINQFGFARLIEIVFSNDAISSWDGRREIWSHAISMIQDFPFTGIGMGSFTEVADALYPFISYPPGRVEHAHNLFLQIAVDLGIPGLIAWLLIWLIVIMLAWRLYRHGRVSQNMQSAALGAGLLCSQLALVIHGMTDAVTWGMVRPAPLVWVVWGVTVAGWNVLAKDTFPA